MVLNFVAFSVDTFWRLTFDKCWCNLYRFGYKQGAKLRGDWNPKCYFIWFVATGAPEVLQRRPQALQMIPGVAKMEPTWTTTSQCVWHPQCVLQPLIKARGWKLVQQDEPTSFSRRWKAAWSEVQEVWPYKSVTGLVSINRQHNQQEHLLKNID